MAVSYSIAPTTRIVRVKLLGDFEGWKDGMHVLLSDSANRPGLGFLIDRRDAEPVTTRFMEDLVRVVLDNRMALTGTRWAIVVSDSPSSLSAELVAELADSSRLSIQIRRFRDLDAAEAWLQEAPGYKGEQGAPRAASTQASDARRPERC
jgi:hypothetical protein